VIPTSSTGPVVTVRDLRMRYGDNDVLTGVDFDVQAGEVVCLLGPNGAGKTTTIEILEGFRIRSAGEISVLGEDPATAGESWRARTGVVLQSWRDHPRWTPRRLLTQLGAYYAPYSTPEHSRPWDVDELLDVVGLVDLADRKISTFSGGQRRRLDVAMGIVGRPELLFLDEPTAGLGTEATARIGALIAELKRVLTIVMIEHDMRFLFGLADHIYVMHWGQVIAEGSPAELRANPWVQRSSLGNAVA
jgi:ABC-2 type transport system ATP-binding protein